MSDSAPFEVIAAPYDIYLAAVGTAFTDIGATPNGSWFKLGSNGSLNYDEDGVTVEHEQNIDLFYSLGATGPRKAFRTQENMKLSFKLADMSAAQYAKALNGAAVTTTANGGGLAGSLNMPLAQGLDVTEFALIARGRNSPAGAGYVSQYQVPICFQSGNPKPVHKKGAPAMLELEWTALWDTSLGFGKYLTQNAPVA